MSRDVSCHLMSMLDQVQGYFMHALVGGVGRHEDKPGSWAFVGLRTEMAVAQLLKARAVLPAGPAPKFLDCGAGLSFVTTLAGGLGFDATGVEWNDGYVSLAKGLFPSTKIIRGDVLTFDGYGDYDVIYYYGPFSDEDIQRSFEEKVEAEAKVAAVII